MSQFERERRYIVLKLKDVEAALTCEEIDLLGELQDKIDAARAASGKEALVAAVVESDWPEYEPTWLAIQARVEAK